MTDRTPSVPDLAPGRARHRPNMPRRIVAAALIIGVSAACGGGSLAVIPPVETSATAPTSLGPSAAGPAATDPASPSSSAPSLAAGDPATTDPATTDPAMTTAARPTPRPTLSAASSAEVSRLLGQVDRALAQLDGDLSAADSAITSPGE